MISVEEALERILGHVQVLEPEEKPILECLGQVLAEDIYSPLDVPPLDNSAMDGYAVQAESTRGATPASPRILEVVGEVAAGSTPQQEVSAGKAIRIMTGAAVPPGADTVVQFEDTDEVERRASAHLPQNQIGIFREVPPDLNIRRAGEDIRRGDLVLPRGMMLRPSEIGVLASLGRKMAPVIRRPEVAIIATGDELTEVGEPLPPGRIYNSNTYSLAAQVLRTGAIPRVLGIARDTVEAVKDMVRKGLDSDLIITSAGVSKGDYDKVKDVLSQEGEITFWTVRMKPGKPLAFGVFDRGGKRVPHLGLPGNPVSSMITFELFARPAILKMMGRTNLTKATISATMESSLKNTDGRRVFARARVTKRDGRYYAKLTGPQGSGILTSMAQADGLVIVPEEVAQIKEGETIRVIMLDWNEEQF
jgi:molybdopterin molybdotransferase